MSSFISYKNEDILICSAARLDTLRKKLLFFANALGLNSKDNLFQFLENLEYSEIATGLNSKEEILQLAQLAELALSSLISDGTYEKYNYEENGKIKNSALEDLKHFVTRLNEIGAHEWENENLFRNRAFMLRPIKQKLLFFANATKLDSSSSLMQFIKNLNGSETNDVNLHSKEDVLLFINLAKLSIKAFISKDSIPKKNANYEQYITNYINSLNEVANNWDNAISDEWKNGKSIISTKFKPEVEPFTKPSIPSKTTVKEFLKQNLLYFLMLIRVVKKISL